MLTCPPAPKHPSAVSLHSFTPVWRRIRVRPVPLGRAFTGRSNSFGLLRLCLAFGVLIGHAWVLGFTRLMPVPLDVPAVSVAGFFGISGFLVTRSALRSSLPRYLWHRAIRILPGLWACLLFTALLVAPVLWYLRYGTLDGLFRSRTGVLSYLQANWWTGMRQFGIGDLLRDDTPYGRMMNAGVFNGSLWSLSYEVLCYFAIAALVLLAVLRRARWVVLGGTAVVFAALCAQLVVHRPLAGGFGPVPLLGWFSHYWLLHCGFMFLLGAVAELYRDRLPISDGLGVVAVVVFLVAATNGQAFSPALVAYEYAILWLAVRLPARLHRVGRTNDYSYGVYLYAFVVQQVLARFGAVRLGLPGYLALCTLVTVGLAALSWHLVEKWALRLKGWTPSLAPVRAYRQRLRPADSQRSYPTDTSVAVGAAPAELSELAAAADAVR